MPDRFDNDDASLFDDDVMSTAITSNEETAEKGSKETTKGHDKITPNETRAVGLVRALVFILLACITAGVAVTVFFYVSTAETTMFEDDFRDSSEKAFDSIGHVFDQALGASDGLMGSLVAYQQNANTSWPFVTLPFFAVKVQKILTLSRALAMGVYPKVMHKDRAAWEEYAFENQAWVDQSLIIQKENPFYKGINLDNYSDYPHIHNNAGISPDKTEYYPTWQASPVVPLWGAWGWDLQEHFENDIRSVETTRQVVVGRTENLPPSPSGNDWIAARVGSDVDPTEPYFPFYYPIVGNSTDAVDASSLEPDTHKFVGIIATTMLWRSIFEEVLAPGSNGLTVVIGNDCNQTLTYQINGPNVIYLGAGDLHDPKYDRYERFSPMAKLGTKSLRERQYSGFPLSAEYCPYWVRLYPSDTMREQYESSDPLVYTVVTVSIFLFTTLFFLVYDFVSQRRQKKVLRVAEQSNAVVSSLFPQVVRDRIFSVHRTTMSKQNDRFSTIAVRLQRFLDKGEDDMSGAGGRTHMESESTPIAELFSETTVMFTDMAGFTAWSSVREPAQVFALLETLYEAYDQIAARRGVFKVETIGDSYVAVAGLPEPRTDHAVVMAKFANDVRQKTQEIVRNLSRTLGPDTGELQIRIGLNSGPVTAGVLRGMRSRFQLFGDTVNTAARMESTGLVSKIHVSQTTADLLKKAGKSHWVTRRDAHIEAKGKGCIQTYWVEPKVREPAQGALGNANVDEVQVEPIDEKTRRLVEWNVEIMVKLLKQIVSRREARNAYGRKPRDKPRIDNRIVVNMAEGSTVLDEVKEIIMLPEFDPALARPVHAPKSIEFSTTVMTQIRDYVTHIASMYPNHAFHNFEHATHVTMSVIKLLRRIVSPADLVTQKADKTDSVFASMLHDHTYGITSDPLTQFACFFCALIHDVDHPGVPNSQLTNENSHLVVKYKGKSMAEQNSVDLSWSLLMEDQFDDFRRLICDSESEMKRFRQLVVNGVMATDIMDKDLKDLRNGRWDKAFSKDRRVGETVTVNTNRKATIVIEHLLQASDVAHTMQHWHIFRKWNERLFQEMHTAYNQGRAERNPADFWYVGELGFFDFYIIPLAKKLSDCGVFGVSSDEYLTYALKNREEWESRGQQVVATMVSKHQGPVKSMREDKDSSQGLKV